MLRLESGLEKMVSRKSAEPSPERIARANRQRLAQEEGARAMADVERSAIAVRKNMERLRALRQAREAQDASAPAIVPDLPKKKRKKAVAK
jgi:hypothetical protein